MVDAERVLALGTVTLLALAASDSAHALESAPSPVRQLNQGGPTVIRHTDLHEMGLKGRVRQVVTRTIRAGTVQSEWRIDFDVTGMRVQPVDPGLTAVVGDDGTRTEIQVVAGAHSCGSRFDPNIGFGCEGAAVARTVIDQSGVLRHTVFEDSEGRLIARIDYTSDANGRVSAAVQRHVFWGRQLRPVPREQSDLLAQLPEFVRIDRSFTDEGDLKSMVTYMAGRRRSVMEYVYDRDRRLVSATDDDLITGEREVVHNYQYLSADAAGNWTSRTNTLTSGTLTEIREISYY